MFMMLLLYFLPRIHETYCFRIRGAWHDILLGWHAADRKESKIVELRYLVLARSCYHKSKENNCGFGVFLSHPLELGQLSYYLLGEVAKFV